MPSLQLREADVFTKSQKKRFDAQQKAKAQRALAALRKLVADPARKELISTLLIVQLFDKGSDTPSTQTVKRRLSLTRKGLEEYVEFWRKGAEDFGFENENQESTTIVRPSLALIEVYELDVKKIQSIHKKLRK